MSEITFGPTEADAPVASPPPIELAPPVPGEAPKLRVPFEMIQAGGIRALTVAQDSTAEIVQCVYAILATEQGSRIDEPEFGVRDQAFRQGGADFEEMREAIARWEPRAREVLTDDQLDGLIQEVRVRVAP